LREGPGIFLDYTSIMQRINPLGSLLHVVLVAALSVLSIGARAESYPARPVRVIVPFPAGGGTDVIARSLGDELSRSLGKPFIVENKPGAGSIMGSDVVSKSPSDGHTLLLTTSAFSIVASIGIKLPCGGIQAFEPVALSAGRRTGCWCATTEDPIGSGLVA
jgi:tripartite-type tricarboxylate transporter receptor subunit TctC